MKYKKQEAKNAKVKIKKCNFNQIRHQNKYASNLQ